MKLAVRPGKKQGGPKILLERKLAEGDLEAGADEVVVRVTANDIYTAKASQQFSITLSREEVDLISRTLTQE